LTSSDNNPCFYFPGAVPEPVLGTLIEKKSQNKWQSRDSGFSRKEMPNNLFKSNMKTNKMTLKKSKWALKGHSRWALQK
jgi:hypothetical protein